MGDAFGVPFGVLFGVPFGVPFGVVFGIPASILTEYPIAAGFPNVIASSGVATTFECRKPVSSNLPKFCILPVGKRGGGLSTDKGDGMLSFLRVNVDSADDALL